MATGSFIGIQIGKGNAKYVYAHYDGYPEGNGVILLNHYKDPKKVKQLISLGEISVLRNEIGEQHDFSADIKLADEKEWTTFYTRDRNDKLEIGKSKLDVESAKKSMSQFGGEYFYVMDAKKVWWVLAYNDEKIPTWTKLTDVLGNKKIDKPAFLERMIEGKNMKKYKFEESKKLNEKVSKEKLELGLTKYLKQEGVSTAYVETIVQYAMKIVQVGIKKGKLDNTTRNKIEKIFQDSLD